MFKKFLKRKPSLIRQRNYQVTLKQWTLDHHLVAKTQAWLNSSEGQVWLDMLQNESPLDQAIMPVVGVNNEARAAQLHAIQGYQLALRTILMSGNMSEPLPEPLQATFEPPEKEI